MIKFFGNIYFVVMEVIMWIVMIGLPITFGAVCAGTYVGGSLVSGFIIGVIIGAILGFIINLCAVPFLQLMEIRNGVKKFVDGEAKLAQDVAEIKTAISKLADGGGHL